MLEFSALVDIFKVDEQYVFSRFQRTNSLVKKLMNSWDIMLHSIEVLAKVCLSILFFTPVPI